METNVKYIFEINKYKNLTKAANELGISQPALSSALNSFEKKLGFRIFDRKSNPIVLTKEGDIYIEYLNKQERLSKEYMRKINEEMNAYEDIVNVGMPAACMNSDIINAIAELYNEKGYRFNLKNESLSELIELCRNGEIDCLISTSDNLPEDFEKEEFMDEKLYLCIPDDFLAKGFDAEDESGEVDYSRLDGMPFIFQNHDQPIQKKTDQFLSAYNITAPVSLTVNQIQTAFLLCRRKCGACIVSEGVLAECNNTDGIHIYKMPDTMMDRKLYIAYLRNHYVTNACKELIDYLRRNRNEK